MKITIVGTGYVGLVSGACFASVGNRVTCVDLVSEKVLSLNKGELPFFEPGLAELISGNIKNGSILFTTDLGPNSSTRNHFEPVGDIEHQASGVSLAVSKIRTVQL